MADRTQHGKGAEERGGSLGAIAVPPSEASGAPRRRPWLGVLAGALALALAARGGWDRGAPAVRAKADGDARVRPFAARVALDAAPAAAEGTSLSPESSASAGAVPARRAEIVGAGPLVELGAQGLGATTVPGAARADVGDLAGAGTFVGPIAPPSLASTVAHARGGRSPGNAARADASGRGSATRGPSARATSSRIDAERFFQDVARRARVACRGEAELHARGRGSAAAVRAHVRVDGGALRAAAPTGPIAALNRCVERAVAATRAPAALDGATSDLTLRWLLP